MCAAAKIAPLLGLPGFSLRSPGLQRSLSDVSELSELPEDGERLDVDGTPGWSSAAPSSDDMLGVHKLSIKSPAQARTRPPLERRSKVLSRELEAEAEAAAASAPHGNSGNSGKCRNWSARSGTRGTRTSGQLRYPNCRTTVHTLWTELTVVHSFGTNLL
jgi:hypothetical protein